MKVFRALCVFLVFASPVLAQDSIPAGTLLPVSLDRSLNAAKLRSGQTIRAEIMQNIPGTSIHRHAHIVGRVVRASAISNGPQTLEIRFESVEFRGQHLPVTTSLRALASRNEVEDAQVPEEGGSRGITPEVATTRQIGGEQDYRGGGPVADGLNYVAKPQPYGVLGIPRTQPGQPCRGAIGASIHPQALWLFSTNACGVYGYDNIRIAHAGRTDPAGTIVLTVEKGKLRIYPGSGLLLRVAGSPPGPAS